MADQRDTAVWRPWLAWGSLALAVIVALLAVAAGEWLAAVVALGVGVVAGTSLYTRSNL